MSAIRSGYFAHQAGDIAAIIALFSDDAWLTMPPFPLEYQGRELIGSFLTAVAFRDGRTYRLIETRANGQLAFGAFLTEPRPGGEDCAAPLQPGPVTHPQVRRNSWLTQGREARL